MEDQARQRRRQGEQQRRREHQRDRRPADVAHRPFEVGDGEGQHRDAGQQRRGDRARADGEGVDQAEQHQRPRVTVAAARRQPAHRREEQHRHGDSARVDAPAVGLQRLLLGEPEGEDRHHQHQHADREQVEIGGAQVVARGDDHRRRGERGHRDLEQALGAGNWERGPQKRQARPGEQGDRRPGGGRGDQGAQPRPDAGHGIERSGDQQQRDADREENEHRARRQGRRAGGRHRQRRITDARQQLRRVSRGVAP